MYKHVHCTCGHCTLYTKQKRTRNTVQWRSSLKGIINAIFHEWS